MRSDRPLILSILLLASGLGLIFGYCNGTAAFNAAFPVAGANLQLSIATYGPAAMGGILLTAGGLVLLIWALICAFVGQIQMIGQGEREPEPVKEYSSREYIPKV